MSGFDDRRQGEEKRYELQQEQEFKAMARRAKLLGRWAGEQMGLQDDALDVYAKSVVLSDLEEAGEEDLFRKIRADLDQHKLNVSDHQIRARMVELLDEARDQIRAGQ